MPSDSLFGPSLTTPEMVLAVSDAAWLRAMLRFEAGLATAEARLGLIPPEAAEAIVAACDPSGFDVGTIGEEAVASATPALALVEALRARCSAEAAAYVHFGATSQDVIDTAMMLVGRDGLDLLLADLLELADACAGLARAHVATVMSGRTLLQHARPITFGFKAAGWIMGILDARRRLRAIRDGGLAVQLGGAVGTLDELGTGGPEVRRELAAELGLQDSPLPWHSNRIRVAELGAALVVAGGAAAKIALDIVLLAQTEVAEVAEARPGRSSAMPHKRNPARAVEARAAFNGLVAQGEILLRALPGEHERAAGSWQAEWPALSEALRLAGGTVRRTRESLEGLHVDAGRMRANLSADLDPDTLRAVERLVTKALAAYEEEG